jgi:hypothetical protein
MHYTLYHAMQVQLNGIDVKKEMKNKERENQTPELSMSGTAGATGWGGGGGSGGGGGGQEGEVGKLHLEACQIVMDECYDKVDNKYIQDAT